MDKIIDYDECIAIHQAYLDKQSALQEIEYEWLDEYEVSVVDNLIARFYHEL